MCHAFFHSASFYRLLFELDRQIAEQVRQAGCPCGGQLHQARYPRKPRGVARDQLRGSCDFRFSFCCANDGCRKRCTPPSLRFLGRKVYLGAIVVLLGALEHGLGTAQRRQLIESLGLWPQTLYRLRIWWQSRFPSSACWRTIAPTYLPPIDTLHLPGAWLGRLSGVDLQHRLVQLLSLMQPITTASCSRYLPVSLDPQRM